MMTIKKVSSQPMESGGKHALQCHSKRDLDVVREAEDRGYFVTIDQKFVKEFLSKQEEKIAEREVVNVRYLALGRLHIRSLDGLGACRNLTVLLLANNFIAKIDALSSCSELLKLDLHGNQIVSLPDPTFWKGLRRLRILHLHDNPIGKYRTIDNMSCCQSLTLLTLSDTPISVRRYYRHHVINTIWSLRALDRHVVSDEEIIEGARFGGRFAAQSQAFELPSSVFKVPGSGEDALASVWRITGRVNSILAHHSPVLIIQRYWRGYLTRSSIRWAMEAELWAAVTIQRRYREWKGRKMELHGSSTPPPAAVAVRRRRRRRRRSLVLTDRCSHETSLLSGRFNYDSYLMSGRSVSSVFTRFSPLPGTKARPPTADGLESVTNLPNATISVDLVKLTMNIEEQLAKEWFETNESSEQTTTKRVETTDSKYSAQRNRLQTTSSTSLHVKPRKIKSVREFFGPVAALENPDGFEDDDDGDSPLAGFRLRGIREEIKICDVREEIDEEKQSGAHFIRLSDEVNHIVSKAQHKPKVSRVPLADIRERENRKYHGAIWLACLHAVGKDYKKAEAAEKVAQQAAYVRRMKETRDGARDRIRAQVADDQRRSAIISHIEQEGLIEDLQDQQIKYSQMTRKYNIARRQSAQFEKIRRYESTFANAFIGRTASCTKADFRFGEQEMREQRTRAKKELVSDLRERTADVRDLRRTYMVERRNRVQDNGIAEKNSLRTKISVSMQERIEAAQSRVTELKRSKTDVSDRRSKHVLMLPIISDPRSSPVPRCHTCDAMEAR